jgi:hypothetical protein
MVWLPDSKLLKAASIGVSKFQYAGHNWENKFSITIGFPIFLSQS